MTDLDDDRFYAGILRLLQHRIALVVLAQKEKRGPRYSGPVYDPTKGGAGDGRTCGRCRKVSRSDARVCGSCGQILRPAGYR